MTFTPQIRIYTLDRAIDAFLMENETRFFVAIQETEQEKGLIPICYSIATELLNEEGEFVQYLISRRIACDDVEEKEIYFTAKLINFRATSSTAGATPLDLNYLQEKIREHLAPAASRPEPIKPKEQQAAASAAPAPQKPKEQQAAASAAPAPQHPLTGEKAWTAAQLEKARRALEGTYSTYHIHELAKQAEQLRPQSREAPKT